MLVLFACTADYDTFGTSGYRVLSEISFENQEGEASFYEDKHYIEINLKAPDDSVSFDSVTVEDFKISHFASIYLVESKIKKFPSDSSALDSLAKEVVHAKKALKKGSTFKLPSSRVVYLLAVSESGASTIWKLSFVINGEKVPESSDSEGETEDKSDKKSSSSKVGSSSSSEKNSSSSSAVAPSNQSSSSVEEKKSDDNSFKISFVGELDQSVSGDTIYVVFALGTDLKNVSVDTSDAFVHRLATVDKDPSKVSDWSKAQTFKVTAENDSVRTWVVIAETVKNSAANLTLKFKNQVSTSLKQGEKADTIAIKLKDSETLEGAKLDTFTVSVGAKVSPVPSEVKSWKSSNSFKVTAEDDTEKSYVLLLAIAEAGYVASSEKNIDSIYAAGQVSAATVNKKDSSIVLHMASKNAMASVDVTIKVSDLASAVLSSKDLRTPQQLTITAEDGSVAHWTVSADYAKSSKAEILSFELERIEPTVAPAIDEKKSSIAFEVAYGTSLSEVYFKYTVSEGAKISTAMPVDLSSGSAKVVVTAEDGSTREWTIVANVAEPPEPPAAKETPRLKALKIDGHDAIIDSVEENGKMFFWAHFDSLAYQADLTNLEVSDFEVTEGAEVSGVDEGSTYDLSSGVILSVSNGAESQEYEVRAGYQYPNGDFEAWNSNKPASWDNGNQKISFVEVTITSSTSSNGGKAVYMKSRNVDIASTFASGNLFVGTMNPKGVAATSMTGYKDGNELIDFGKPFAARPRYMEVDMKYTGKGDSCDVYIVLENRPNPTRTCKNGSTPGSNVCRESGEVNTLIASAWYRATTDNDVTKPDVVSISEPNSAGHRTLRMKLRYGEPDAQSPMMKDKGNTEGKVATLYDGDLAHTNGIDNHVTIGDSSLPVTHIRIVFASSGDGNHYKGSDGATFVVDNFKLIY